ncbi:MAG: hypothetical protein U0841_17630 [Chloroflexia bacterium]
MFEASGHGHQGVEMTPEERFDGITEQLARTHEAVAAGKLFGVRCIKVNGKAFASFHGKDMVFKLRGAQHAEALALYGATLFDPSGKGRPMREWVVVPVAHADRWEGFAESALRVVGGGA